MPVETQRRYMDKNMARAIVRLLSNCYKAGIKDAEYISDKALCEDFKVTVREPGVYGRITESRTYNIKEWQIRLLFIHDATSVSNSVKTLLGAITTPKGYLSCIFPVAQEFYIQGIDDFNAYPHIHDFTQFDKPKTQRCCGLMMNKDKLH